METIVSELVDIESAALPGGVSKPCCDIRQCQGSILRPDCLEDDSPRARGAGNIHFDATREPCPRRMLSKALAALVAWHTLSFVALAGGSQRLCRVGIRTAVMVK
jgi:hypothetical protein